MVAVGGGPCAGAGAAGGEGEAGRLLEGVLLVGIARRACASGWVLSRLGTCCGPGLGRWCWVRVLGCLHCAGCAAGIGRGRGGWYSRVLARWRIGGRRFRCGTEVVVGVKVAI